MKNWILIPLLVLLAACGPDQRTMFMEQCLKDKKDYECQALYGQAQTAGQRFDSMDVITAYLLTQHVLGGSSSPRTVTNNYVAPRVSPKPWDADLVKPQRDTTYRPAWTGAGIKPTWKSNSGSTSFKSSASAPKISTYRPSSIRGYHR